MRAVGVSGVIRGLATPPPFRAEFLLRVVRPYALGLLLFLGDLAEPLRQARAAVRVVTFRCRRLQK